MEGRNKMGQVFFDEVVVIDWYPGVPAHHSAKGASDPCVTYVPAMGPWRIALTGPPARPRSR